MERHLNLPCASLGSVGQESGCSSEISSGTSHSQLSREGTFCSSLDDPDSPTAVEKKVCLVTKSSDNLCLLDGHNNSVCPCGVLATNEESLLPFEVSSKSLVSPSVDVTAHCVSEIPSHNVVLHSETEEDIHVNDISLDNTILPGQGVGRVNLIDSDSKNNLSPSNGDHPIVEDSNKCVLPVVCEKKIFPSEDCMVESLPLEGIEKAAFPFDISSDSIVCPAKQETTASLIDVPLGSSHLPAELSQPSNSEIIVYPCQALSDNFLLLPETKKTKSPSNLSPESSLSVVTSEKTVFTPEITPQISSLTNEDLKIAFLTEPSIDSIISPAETDCTVNSLSDTFDQSNGCPDGVLSLGTSANNLSSLTCIEEANCSTRSFNYMKDQSIQFLNEQPESNNPLPTDTVHNSQPSKSSLDSIHSPLQNTCTTNLSSDKLLLTSNCEDNIKEFDLPSDKLSPWANTEEINSNTNLFSDNPSLLDTSGETAGPSESFQGNTSLPTDCHSDKGTCLSEADGTSAQKVLTDIFPLSDFCEKEVQTFKNLSHNFSKKIVETICSNDKPLDNTAFSDGVVNSVNLIDASSANILTPVDAVSPFSVLLGKFPLPADCERNNYPETETKSCTKKISDGIHLLESKEQTACPAKEPPDNTPLTGQNLNGKSLTEASSENILLQAEASFPINTFSDKVQTECDKKTLESEGYADKSPSVAEADIPESIKVSPEKAKTVVSSSEPIPDIFSSSNDTKANCCLTEVQTDNIFKLAELSSDNITTGVLREVKPSLNNIPLQFVVENPNSATDTSSNDVNFSEKTEGSISPCKTSQSNPSLSNVNEKNVCLMESFSENISQIQPTCPVEAFTLPSCEEINSPVAIPIESFPSQTWAEKKIDSLILSLDTFSWLGKGENTYSSTEATPNKFALQDGYKVHSFPTVLSSENAFSLSESLNQHPISNIPLQYLTENSSTNRSTNNFNFSEQNEKVISRPKASSENVALIDADEKRVCLIESFTGGRLSQTETCPVKDYTNPPPPSCEETDSLLKVPIDDFSSQAWTEEKNDTLYVLSDNFPWQEKSDTVDSSTEAMADQFLFPFYNETDSCSNMLSSEDIFLPTVVASTIQHCLDSVPEQFLEEKEDSSTGKFSDHLHFSKGSEKAIAQPVASQDNSSLSKGDENSMCLIELFSDSLLSQTMELWHSSCEVPEDSFPSHTWTEDNNYFCKLSPGVFPCLEEGMVNVSSIGSAPDKLPFTDGIKTKCCCTELPSDNTLSPNEAVSTFEPSVDNIPLQFLVENPSIGRPSKNFNFSEESEKAISQPEVSQDNDSLSVFNNRVCLTKSVPDNILSPETGCPIMAFTDAPDSCEERHSPIEVPLEKLTLHPFTDGLNYSDNIQSSSQPLTETDIKTVCLSEAIQDKAFVTDQNEKVCLTELVTENLLSSVESVEQLSVTCPLTSDNDEDSAASEIYTDCFFSFDENEDTICSNKVSSDIFSSLVKGEETVYRTESEQNKNSLEGEAAENVGLTESATDNTLFPSALNLLSNSTENGSLFEVSANNLNSCAGTDETNSSVKISSDNFPLLGEDKETVNSTEIYTDNWSLRDDCLMTLSSGDCCPPTMTEDIITELSLLTICTEKENSLNEMYPNSFVLLEENGCAVTPAEPSLTTSSLTTLSGEDEEKTHLGELSLQEKAESLVNVFHDVIPLQTFCKETMSSFYLPLENQSVEATEAVNLSNDSSNIVHANNETAHLCEITTEIDFLPASNITLGTSPDISCNVPQEIIGKELDGQDITHPEKVQFSGTNVKIPCSLEDTFENVPLLTYPNALCLPLGTKELAHISPFTVPLSDACEDSESHTNVSFASSSNNNESSPSSFCSPIKTKESTDFDDISFAVQDFIPVTDIFSPETHDKPSSPLEPTFNISALPADEDSTGQTVSSFLDTEEESECVTEATPDGSASSKDISVISEEENICLTDKSPVAFSLTSFDEQFKTVIESATEAIKSLNLTSDLISSSEKSITVRSSDSEGAFETPESTTPVKAPPSPQPDLHLQIQPETTELSSDITCPSNEPQINADSEVSFSPYQSSSIVFDEDKPIASSGTYNLDFVNNDVIDPCQSELNSLEKLGLEHKQPTRRRSTDSVPVSKSTLTRSLSLQAGELDDSTKQDCFGGTEESSSAVSFSIGTESDHGTLKRTRKPKPGSLKRKPKLKVDSLSDVRPEEKISQSSPDLSSKKKIPTKTSTEGEAENNQEGSRAEGALQACVLKDLHHKGEEEAQKDEILFKAESESSVRNRQQKLDVTCIVQSESPVAGFSVNVLDTEVKGGNKTSNIADEQTSQEATITNTTEVREDGNSNFAKSSYDWDPDNYESINPFCTGKSKLSNSPVAVRKCVVFNTVPESPEEAPESSQNDTPLNKRQSIRLEFDYSEETLNCEGIQENVVTPKKLIKKPGGKMPPKKLKSGSKKPSAIERLDSTSSEQSANFDEMPLPRFSYDFDPNKWDDPNFNPFSSGNKMTNSPKFSNKTYSFESESYDDSFSLSIKTGNSTNTSFEVPSNDNELDGLDDTNKNKSTKKKKAPLKTNTFRVKKSPKRSAVLDQSSQESTPLPTPETPPVISGEEHATDEEKLASSVTNQKCTYSHEYGSDNEDYPQTPDLSAFVNKMNLNSPSEVQSYNPYYEIKHMEEPGSPLSEDLLSAQKQALYLNLHPKDSPSKASPVMTYDPPSICSGVENEEALDAFETKSYAEEHLLSSFELSKQNENSLSSPLSESGKTDLVLLGEATDLNDDLMNRMSQKREDSGELVYLEPDLDQTSPSPFIHKLQQMDTSMADDILFTKLMLYPSSEKEETKSEEQEDLNSALEIARKKIVAKEREVIEWQRKYEESRTEVDEMRKIVAEYEKTIAQMIENEQQEKSFSHHTIQQLILEKEQALSDLNSVEKSLAELFRRYEKMKQVLDDFRKNEDILKKCAQEYLTRVKKEEQRYHALKIHAEEKLEKANAEIAQVRAKSKQEQAAYQASLRKEQMRVDSLERTLEQKNKEIEELTKICDELISKMGKN
ncbi:uncharacterized protein LOC114645325 isoform X11 [Erpetoichthys calabaricus]|uniref:uncharacterized protein LOC114645325 isoform X10 n=1 Tax=Erpetoichthys calabaricus TaxID=27687 RepID=UPI0022349738|nr:uncharacterized protein LOC114645325 isoform X10 [Erpetoichthys calabaricus]XP_051778645.1 uncharacterized protein LOC114645325 isoform X11 [Erpetoichthys calabaricus]